MEKKKLSEEWLKIEKQQQNYDQEKSVYTIVI